MIPRNFQVSYISGTQTRDRGMVMNVIYENNYFLKLYLLYNFDYNIGVPFTFL